MTPEAAAPPLALIVDDEATIRLLLSQTLETVGFRAEEAEDGPTALAMIERLAPKLVLLDARLPGMDGFAVCRAIRQLPTGKAVAVVMMTGMDEAGLRSRALEVGATDIIGKPFRLVELGQRLRALVAG